MGEVRGGTPAAAGEADAGAVVVRVERAGHVAVLVVDNPPVNALGIAVRRALRDALLGLDGDVTVSAIGLAAAGRTFCVGADIAEFDKPAESPTLRELIATLRGLSKPTAAALHGNVLGGGLELALACRLRVADAGCRLGFPEVQLGLIPGAGGTVYLPRLIGAERALRMILSGEPVAAAEALGLGLVDKVVGDHPRAAMIEMLREAAEAGLRSAGGRKHARAATPLPDFDVLAAELLAKNKDLEAPAACVAAIRNSLTMDEDAAFAEERRIFERLRQGKESRALRHMFFAERSAGRAAAKAARPRPVESIGVIGAGTMGTGIAMAFAAAGLPVAVVERDSGALAAGLGRVDTLYAGSVSRGSLPPEAAAARRARVVGTTDYSMLASCDLVVEAAFEDMEVKRGVFARLDAVCRPGAILATNTSYLDVNEIAAATGRPEDVVGMHFFSPANVMRVVEVVRANRTDPAVLATAIAVSRRIGKVPVPVGVCHGFVGNRMLGARNAQMIDLVIEGAMLQDVDRTFREFGWPMGPFEMWDMAGLDISWRARKAQGKALAIADELCAQGRFGQKSGRGFYRYEPGSRTPLPDEDVTRLIHEEARRRGVQRRDIEATEIIERTHYPMVNEGMRTLEEAVANSASDIDVIWVLGYGFPRAKGGPMHWASDIGWDVVAERLDHWRGKTGSDLFRPATRG